MTGKRLTFTTDEMRRIFGNPMPHVNEDGSVDGLWETLTLAMVRLPAPLPLSWNRDVTVRQFRSHRLLVPNFTRALNAIYHEKEAWTTIDDFGGCYAWRVNRRSRTELSKHAWGAAIDLDVCDNPQGRTPRCHPFVVEAFEREGFIWGGRFSGRARDGMHFEFADERRLRG
jgi:hypothetical protein